MSKKNVDVQKSVLDVELGDDVDVGRAREKRTCWTVGGAGTVRWKGEWEGRG